MYKRLWIAGLLLALTFFVVMAQEQPGGTINDNRPFVEVPLILDSATIVTIDLTATSGDLDPLLFLVDESGSILAENDDRGPGDYNARINALRLPRGEYTIVATRFGVTNGDSEGDYSLDIQRSTLDTFLPEYVVSDTGLSAAGFPEIAPRERADWVVLAYYGGDTDLEAAIMKDFDEFEVAGGSDETVRIVALLDRHPAYSDANGNWNTARLYEIGPDVTGDWATTYPPTMDTDFLTDLGDINTGTGESLAQFLVWSLKNFPADHYAIAFASHGGGWNGLIKDDTANDSVITLPEFRSAFDLALSINNGDRFDLLINDACIMSSVEYYGIMADYFNVSLASPEIVVDPALDMSLLTSTLRRDPQVEMVTLGQDLVDTYMQRDILLRPGPDTAFLSHAVTDLNRFDPVIQAVEKFATIINRDPDRFASLLGLARANTYTFSEFLGERDKVDVGHFMQQVIAYTAEPELVLAARDVIQTLEEARLYGSAGPGAERFTSYYNIYFPKISSEFNVGYFSDSPLVNWGQMLASYYSAITPRMWQVDDSVLIYHPPQRPQVKVTKVYPEVSSTAFPPTLALEVIGNRLAEGDFTVDVVDGDRTIRLLETSIMTEVFTGDTVDLVNHWKSGIDLSEFNWLPVNLPMVNDGINSHNELLIKTEEMVALEGRYRTGGGDWNEVAVVFDYDGRVQQVISRSGELGTLAPTEIPLGAEFQAYRFVVAGNGDVKGEAGNTYIWPEGGLTWSDEPAPSGQYDLGFVVKTFGGTVGSDSVRITLDNAAPSEAYVGYTDMGLGINFQRPVDWGMVGDFGNRLTTVAENELAEINIYYFPFSDLPYGILGEIQRENRWVLDGPAQFVTVAGVQALEASYSFPKDTNWRGRAFVFHRETADGSTGFVFTVNARADNEQVVDEVYPVLRDTLTVFDAVALAETGESTWRYDFVRDLAYPVPVSWLSSPDSVWTVYTPLTGPSGQFAAVGRMADNNANRVMSSLIDEFALDMQITRRTYVGESHTWDSVHYSGKVDNVEIAGRVYVTTVDARVYALHFRTPVDGTEVNVFRTVFEPMLDGFAPPLSVPFSSGGVQPAFIKAAVVASNESCDDVGLNQVCTGQGEVNATYVDTGRGLNQPAQQTIDNLESLEVGILDDGMIDPLSIAVVSVQGNLSAESGGVRILAFGGLTVNNLSRPDPAQLDQVWLENIAGQRVNIRALPQAGARILAAFDPGELVEAVSLLEDGSWIRVKLPDDPSRTGWVLASLLSRPDDMGRLRIGDPTVPHFVSMQSLEVLVTDGSSYASLLNGLLIIVPEGLRAFDLEINGVQYKLAPGAVVFWRADGGDTSEVDLDASGEVLLIAKRRPGAWATDVLRGALRVEIRNEENGTRSLTTSFSGGSISYNPENDKPQIEGFEMMQSAVGQALLTSDPESQPMQQLTKEEIQQIIDEQPFFNSIDMADINDIADYYNLPDFIDPVDLVEFILDESDVNLDEIRNLDDLSEVVREIVDQLETPTPEPTVETPVVTPEPPAETPVVTPEPPVETPVVTPEMTPEVPVETPVVTPEVPVELYLIPPSLVECGLEETVSAVVEFYASDGATISQAEATSIQAQIASINYVSILDGTRFEVNLNCVGVGENGIDLAVTDSAGRIVTGGFTIIVFESRVGQDEVFLSPPSIVECSIEESVPVTVGFYASDGAILTEASAVSLQPAVAIESGVMVLDSVTFEVYIFCAGAGETAFDISATDDTGRVTSGSFTVIVSG